MRTIRRNFSSMRECTFDLVDADGEVPILVPGNEALNGGIPVLVGL